MNLLIFDIDGTLTQTNSIDSHCFANAVKDVANINQLNTDWASYRYSTDSGILNEIFESHFNAEPSSHDVELIQDRFLSYLKSAWLADKSSIEPIPGASTIFQKVGLLSDWHLGIATGGWKQTALFKLKSANIIHTSIPIACADENMERTKIIQITIKHALMQNRMNRYNHIVYVGDKLWDERAAAQLGIGFIGVGLEIMKQSSHYCINDYSESDGFIEHLRKISS